LIFLTFSLSTNSRVRCLESGLEVPGRHTSRSRVAGRVAGWDGDEAYEVECGIGGRGWRRDGGMKRVRERGEEAGCEAAMRG
jgi:hypothetical protein